MTDPWVRKDVLGDTTLYLGDCRDILPMLSGVDTIVSDPPYGIDHRKGRGGAVRTAGIGSWTAPINRNTSRIVGDHAPFDPSHLLCFNRVILWGANHYARALPDGRWLAWNKLAGRPPFDSFSDVEFAWRNGHGKDVIFNHLWKGILRDSENKGERRSHPTQKPVALMRWCIRQLGSDAGAVCDPYMGSGTTGVACARFGAPFIGIEIDPGYYKIACERIDEAQRQGRLFDGPAGTQPAEQLTMLNDEAAS